MDVEIARGLDDALAYLAAHPDAEPIAGGTDLMVEINFGRRRPERVIAIDRIEALREISSNGHVRVGSGVTYARMLDADGLPRALLQAARTVGSPQIRKPGTLCRSSRRSTRPSFSSRGAARAACRSRSS